MLSSEQMQRSRTYLRSLWEQDPTCIFRIESAANGAIIGAECIAEVTPPEADNHRLTAKGSFLYFRRSQVPEMYQRLNAKQ